MKLLFLDKLGAIGTFAAAISCPVCWPLFASLGSALGLGFLLPYEGTIMRVVFPGFVGLGLIGSVVSFLYHREKLPLVVGVASALLIFYGFYGGWYRLPMYIGIFGLPVSAMLSVAANRRKRISCTTQECDLAPLGSVNP